MAPEARRELASELARWVTHMHLCWQDAFDSCQRPAEQRSSASAADMDADTINRHSLKLQFVRESQRHESSGSGSICRSSRDS